MAIDPKRVKEIFLGAAEMSDEAARAAYLDQACGGDAGLRARVEALLRSHDPEGSFLGTPAAVVPAPDHAATGDSAPAPDHAAARTRDGGAGTADDEPLTFLAPPTRPDALGRIGHYEVLQVLGKGGFGIVLRAFDDVLQRVVAVKVLAPQLAAMSPARKRFLREARTSAAVRHENVVQVYEVGEQPLPYIAMEFIPGETLQQRLDRIGPVEPAEVVRVGRRIAEGLAAAHATDLVHRDIKPGNILLEGGQLKVKITDFGLARAADDASISHSGIIAGTPLYMAPEQALGQKLDQRADLFSLGSVLYVMAAGRPPFRADGTVAVLRRVADDTPRDIREIIPETPPWLCDIIAKLHAKNPDDRYQSAREVADVLADCEAQLRANHKLKDYSRIPRSKQAAAGKSGGWKWVVAAVLLLPVIALAVIALAVIAYLSRGQVTHVPLPAGAEVELTKPSVRSVRAADDAEAKAVALVEKLGGKVERDEKMEGKPVRFIDLARSKVTDAGLKEIAACKQLQRLDLSNCPHVTDEALRELAACTQLQELNLAHCSSLTDAWLKELAACKQLQSLNLTWCFHVTDWGLKELAACKQLRVLILDHCYEVTDAGLKELAAWKQLQELDLHFCTKLTAAGLKEIAVCTQLQRLNLECCRGVTTAALKEIATCTQLQRLNLSITRVMDAGLKELAACEKLQELILFGGDEVTDAGLKELAACTQLRVLKLSQCSTVTDAALKELAAYKQLQELDLSGCKQVTDAGLKELAACMQLQKLDLSDCEQVTGAGLKELATCTQLQKLVLSGCKEVTDAGLKELAASKQLQDLSLADCKEVTDAGLKELAACKQLQRLVINWCDQVTDAGLKELAASKQLQQLFLYGCRRVTTRGKDELKKALPKLKVTP